MNLQKNFFQNYKNSTDGVFSNLPKQSFGLNSHLDWIRKRTFSKTSFRNYVIIFYRNVWTRWRSVISDSSPLKSENSVQSFLVFYMSFICLLYVHFWPISNKWQKNKKSPSLPSSTKVDCDLMISTQNYLAEMTLIYQNRTRMIWTIDLLR